MKMTSRDKELLFLALSLGIVAASWMGGARLLKQKTEQLSVRKEELQQEYDERMRVLEKKEQYLKDTKEYNEAYQLMMARFPGGISTQEQILFVTGLEERFSTQIVSVSYTDEAEAYTFQSVEPDSYAPYALTTGAIQIPVELSYSQWKDFLDYVFSYQDKTTLPSVTASYNEEADIVSATVTMNQYAIVGEGRTLEEQNLNIPVGTDNIFKSGTALSYSGSQAEQIEAIKKDYDCYLMLYPAASDVKAKVIAGPGDAEKVISESNEEETLTVTAEESDGQVSITYTLGNNRPRVLYPEESDTVDVYVLSTPRMGNADVSGVKVQIENQTSKTMRFAVVGDDDTRPRFVVESQSGSVEILK